MRFLNKKTYPKQNKCNCEENRKLDVIINKTELIIMETDDAIDLLPN